MLPTVNSEGCSSDYLITNFIKKDSNYCDTSLNEEEQEHASRICILFQLHRAIDTSHVQGNYIPLYRRDPAYPRKDVIGRPNNTRE